MYAGTAVLGAAASSDAPRDRCRKRGPAGVLSSPTGKRKLVARESICCIKSPSGGVCQLLDSTCPGMTLQQVRTMLDIDECMAM